MGMEAWDNEDPEWGSGLSYGLQGAAALAPLGPWAAGVGFLGGGIYGMTQGAEEKRQFRENAKRQEQLYLGQMNLSEANRAQARRLANEQMNSNMGATAQQYAKQQAQLRSNLASRGLLGTGGEAAAQGAFAGQRAQSLAAQQQAAQVQQAQADMIARSQAGMISANAEQSRLKNQQAWNQRNQALFSNAIGAVSRVGGLALQSPEFRNLYKGFGETAQAAATDTMKGLGVGAQQLGAYAQDTAKGLGVGAQQLGAYAQDTAKGLGFGIQQLKPLEPAMEVETQPYDIRTAAQVRQAQVDSDLQRTRDDILDDLGTPAAIGEGLGPTFATPQQRVTFELKNLLGVETSPSWQQEMAEMDPGTYRRRLAELRSRPGLRVEYKNGRPVVVDNAAVADRFSAAYKYFNPYEISN